MGCIAKLWQESCEQETEEWPYRFITLCHCNERFHFLLPFLSFEWSSFLFWPNAEFLPSSIQIALSWVLNSSWIFLAIWPHVIESHRKGKVCHHRTVWDSSMFLAFLQPPACKTLAVSWHQESQTDDHIFFCSPQKAWCKTHWNWWKYKGLWPGIMARNNSLAFQPGIMLKRYLELRWYKGTNPSHLPLASGSIWFELASFCCELSSKPQRQLDSSHLA